MSYSHNTNNWETKWSTANTSDTVWAYGPIEVPQTYYYRDGETVHAFSSKEELDNYLANKPKKKVLLSLCIPDDYDDDNRIFILVVDEKKSYVRRSHYVVFSEGKLLKLNNDYGDKHGICFWTGKEKEDD